MNLEQLEKLYRDTPAIKGRWSEFSTFSNQALAPRQTMDLGFNFNPGSETAKAKLRKPEQNEFGGLASAFGVKIDAWMPSYIEPGAFKHTLADTAQRSRVRVLYQHMQTQPIGVPTFMEEVPEGLLVMGKISETSLGKDALILLRDEVISEMSIGFDPVEFSFKEDKDGELCRHIHECRLWEFSPVSFGANAGAKITTVNSLEAQDLDRLAARVVELMQRSQKQPQTPDEIRAEISRLTGLLSPPHVEKVDHSQTFAQLEELSRLIIS